MAGPLLAVGLVGIAGGWFAAGARAAEDTLPLSRERLQRFPFQPDCAGNTGEMVACLWRQRNQADATLAPLLRTPELLEQWRATRRRVCGQAAEKARGGSIQPIIGLNCENSLHQELLRLLRQPGPQRPDR